MNIAVNSLGFAACSDCTRIQNKTLIREVNKADGFTFTVYPGDPTFDLLYTNKCSFVTAYDDIYGEVVFRGRINSMTPRTDGTNSYKEVSCEGPLGYLRDSVVFGIYVENTKEENDEIVPNKVYFGDVISQFMVNHNKQVSDELKYDENIVIHNPDPTNQEFGILKNSHSFDGVDTMSALDEILDDLGFECTVVWQMYVPHWVLHISPKFGYHAPDPIVTGLNLKSLTEELDGSELVTSILPMGGVGYDEKRLMLGPISMGDDLDYTPYMPIGAQGSDWYNESQAWYAKMYVDNDTLVSKYGRHIGVETFDDIVANAEDEVKAKRIALREKACETAAKLSDVEDEFDIEVYDLYRAGYDVGALVLYNTYTVRDINLDITVDARFTKQETDYDNLLESICTFTVKTEKESSVS